MNRLPLSLAVLSLVAVSCGPSMGDPRPMDLPAVALVAPPATGADVAAAALAETRPRVALVMGPADPGWFDAVAQGARLTPVTGPGVLETELAVAFLGREAVGDTTLSIAYEGGSFILHDALFDLGQGRMLDLLAFRINGPSEVRAMLGALSAYVATDVMPGAAVIMAVAVPTPAVGDSVARLLSPMYDGVSRCGVPMDDVASVGVRLFYGPEARIFCRSAGAERTAAGDLVRADLVVGRRR
jgi:hypothetical protein